MQLLLWQRIRTAHPACGKAHSRRGEPSKGSPPLLHPPPPDQAKTKIPAFNNFQAINLLREDSAGSFCGRDNLEIEPDGIFAAGLANLPLGARRYSVVVILTSFFSPFFHSV